MKTLTAKVMIANFQELNSDKQCAYPVHVFDNGLVLVPSDSTSDWFFDSPENIEGNGNDILTHIEETEKSVTYNALDLAQTWGNCYQEFYTYATDAKCLNKVKELVK